MSHRTLKPLILSNTFLPQIKMQKSDWSYLSLFLRKKIQTDSRVKNGPKENILSKLTCHRKVGPWLQGYPESATRVLHSNLE